MLGHPTDVQLKHLSHTPHFPQLLDILSRTSQPSSPRSCPLEVRINEVARDLYGDLNFYTYGGYMRDFMRGLLNPSPT